jgi:hypothetical protein
MIYAWGKIVQPLLGEACVNGVEVTCRDLETGEIETKVCEPGDYILVAVAPLELAGVQHYGTGTRVLTLKRAEPETTLWTPPLRDPDEPPYLGPL